MFGERVAEASEVESVMTDDGRNWFRFWMRRAVEARGAGVQR